MNTIDYYNQNAQKFVENTVNVDFHFTQEKFLSYLKSDAKILDFGCGAGRDTKFFMEKGYSVEAIDGSIELCKYAREYTGIHVKQMFFQDLDTVDRYDGIWACSSILHLPYNELLQVVKKMTEALKNNGVIYTSFKYGTFEGVRNGRYFIDMTEETFLELLRKIGKLKIAEQWISPDVRPGRGNEKWLNLILQKI